MLKIESLLAEAEQQEVVDLSITAKLRLVMLPVLMKNLQIVDALEGQSSSFTSLALRKPDGTLTTQLPEIDSENRAMLNELYRQCGIEYLYDPYEFVDSDSHGRARRMLTTPGGITFVETISEVQNWRNAKKEIVDWTMFDVRACTPNDVIGRQQLELENT